MKSLFQFLLFLALSVLVLGLLQKYIPGDKPTPKPVPAPAPLLAPTLPQFSLHHEKPTLLDKIINQFDEKQVKGSEILDACLVNEIHQNAIEMIAEENADKPLNLGQFCDLFDNAQTWAYVNDPAGRDYFATPVQSIRTRRGDCDDYAIFLASLNSTIGFETDIVVCILPSGEYHAFPEVCLGPVNPGYVKRYLSKRYGLSSDEQVYFQADTLQNLYISLDRGNYPGESPSKGKILMRLYLTDHFVDQY